MPSELPRCQTAPVQPASLRRQQVHGQRRSRRERSQRAQLDTKLVTHARAEADGAGIITHPASRKPAYSDYNREQSSERIIERQCVKQRPAARADSGTAPSFQARTGAPASVASTSGPTRGSTASCTQRDACFASRTPRSSASTWAARSLTRYKRQVLIACNSRAPALVTSTDFKCISRLTLDVQMHRTEGCPASPARSPELRLGARVLRAARRVAQRRQAPAAAALGAGVAAAGGGGRRAPASTRSALGWRSSEKIKHADADEPCRSRRRMRLAPVCNVSHR